MAKTDDKSASDKQEALNAGRDSALAAYNDMLEAQEHSGGRV